MDLKKVLEDAKKKNAEIKEENAKQTKKVKGQTKEYRDEQLGFKVVESSFLPENPMPESVAENPCGNSLKDEIALLRELIQGLQNENKQMRTIVGEHLGIQLREVVEENERLRKVLGGAELTGVDSNGISLERTTRTVAVEVGKEEAGGGTLDFEQTEPKEVSVLDWCQVYMAQGLTLNIGNYESARFDVSVKEFCPKSQKTEKLAELKNWCSERIKEQKDRVDEYRRKRGV